jgi:hypothetical protein
MYWGIAFGGVCDQFSQTEESGDLGKSLKTGEWAELVRTFWHETNVEEKRAFRTVLRSAIGHEFT